MCVCISKTGGREGFWETPRVEGSFGKRIEMENCGALFFFKKRGGGARPFQAMDFIFWIHSGDKRQVGVG